MPKWWGPISKIIVSKSAAVVVALLMLLVGFQNCNGTKFGSVEQSSLSSSSVNECSPTRSRACLVPNGVGAEFCDNNENSLGCNVIGCDPGYLVNNNACVPMACTPSSQTQCSVPNGSGVKVCDSSGSQYGPCAPNSCNPGYILLNGACESVVCQIPSSQNCSVPNGNGSQSCEAGNNGRNAWNACVPQSCNPGYILYNNICMAGVCTPGTTTPCTFGPGSGNKTCTEQAIWGSCLLNACSGNYRLENGVCIENACQPGAIDNCKFGNGSGTYTCNSLGSGYGACMLTSCDPGYNLQTGTDGNKVCVPNACTPSSQTPCTEGNGTGLKTCNMQGTGYGSCVLSSCNEGYNLQNGVCVANACTPGAPSACAEGNGSGTKLCNSQGTGYGSCVLDKCNTGFNFEVLPPNNRCVAQACQPDSTQPCTQDHGSGLKTCNTQGTGYGSCVLNSCEENYSLIGGVCVLNVCAPNSSASCAANNGTGTKTCNAQGTAYGSCVLNACDTGFYSQGSPPNLTCLPQVCEPNSSANCSVPNGTGSHTCNSTGSDYGSCTMVSCNAGYNAQNGQCVQNVCTPNSSSSCPLPNGTGTHTCNSTGSDYGVCSLVSCNSGYNAQNGQCVQNICSPNTSSSCPITNGTGSHTCNSTGSAYGSCNLVSCNSGYNAQNGQCVQNICSPNTSSSCPITNGTGSHTCNSTGSAYGSCNLVSCNSGYNAQNGKCVANVCSPGTSTTSGCTQPANGESKRTCNSTGSAYGSCSSTCDAGFTATGTQPNISCYGNWIQTQPASCSPGCGQAATTNTGTVVCSTSSCNPATKPQPLTLNCAATAACPLISWIPKSSSCGGSTPVDTQLKTNKSGYGGSIGSENSNESYKMCANFSSAWGTYPPDSSWIDSGLRDDSDSTHSLSENSNSGSLQTWWIKSAGIGTSRWYRTYASSTNYGCPTGWYPLTIWDDSYGRRDLCEGGSEDRHDNLCIYPMPAKCDSVMLCAGGTFKVLNYNIPATSAISTSQMDAYCNAHARGGVNDYHFNLGDHAGGVGSGNNEGAYYGSCFSKSAKSTGSRTTGPNGSSAFTCVCN